MVRAHRIPAANDALLTVRELCKYFPVRNAFGWRTAWLKAIDGIGFQLLPGETLGIVGESGCGKSTVGKTLIGVHRADRGEVIFEGRKISGLGASERRAIGKKIQYIYQDPGASLDPRWKISASMHEPMIIHTDLNRRQRELKINEILQAVGLPRTHLDLYPHELSGGQQRRIGLARILTLQPKLVILDEPTSGLDVSVQSSVLKLLQRLGREFNLTFIFISHDLNVINLMCDRVAVMYLGRIVEIGKTSDMLNNPKHPYTQLLNSANPRIGGERYTRSFNLTGELPDPIDLPTGCRFQSRCPHIFNQCRACDPTLSRTDEGWDVACHLPSPQTAPTEKKSEKFR